MAKRYLLNKKKSEKELAFVVAMEEKSPFPHLGGLLGETGVREKSFLRSRVQ